MFLTVAAVCDRQNAVWQGLPAFADAVSRFKSYLPKIQQLIQTQSVTSLGRAADKQRYREQLASRVVAVGGATAAYASKRGDHPLAARAQVSPSDILYTRDGVAFARAQTVHDAARASLADLGDYGVTLAELDELKALIDGFGAKLPSPRDGVVSAAGATESLSDTFADADEILRGQMDALMPRFEISDPVFATEYRHARDIPDHPATVTRETPPPPPAPSPAA
jgi:hypothetical protein